ncbi:hypothetical protein SAMN05216271_3335 [Halopseudomonas sabulinigri]|uniref:Uncharacterized protein n=1 Tax=Halopseudomonas sabulinigri TaxID=472181 RepID=A0A1H1WUB0_9GAMM|nr:hypothetical protein [Halopseudomonas sabulinigri]SDT00632.1 hypothetical protein SAMN05216271_3335 [Halopseudomonas sabulinigri]
MSPWLPVHPAQLVFGLVIWSGWFVLLYGGLSVACELVPPAEKRGAMTWLNGLILLLGAALAVFLLWLARRCWRAAPVSDQGTDSGRFVARIAAGVYLTSALAAFALTLPSVVMAPCL